VVLGGAYATDPYELVGDVTAESSKVFVPATAFAATNNAMGGGRLTSSRTSSSISTNAVAGSPTFSNTVSNPVNAVLPSNQATAFAPLVNTPVSMSTTGSTYVYNPTYLPTSSLTSTSVNTPSNTFVNTPVNTNVNTNVFVGGNFPFLPLSFGGGKGKGLLGDSIKQGRAYQPSLTAAVLGIRGSRPSAYGIKTGLTVRPL
jgi:hypothetical protein